APYVVARGASRVFNDGPDNLPGTADDFTIGHGLNVFHLAALQMSRDSQLRIDGFPDSTVIIQIAGRVSFGRRNSAVVLAGGLTESSVLFEALGTGSAVSVRGHVRGTILAPARRGI